MTTHDVVSAALRVHDRRTRWQAWMFWGGVAIEAALIVAFLFLADWKNRTHVLLFISTLGVFYALALGVVSLTLRLDDSTRRVLTAVGLIRAGS